MGEYKDYDFSGWATRNDIECSDGRTIRQNAFADDDGKRVPLVWNHQHSSPDNVLGHAFLENKPDGVRFYGYLNDTAKGKLSRELIEHGDINAVSILANRLKERGGNVMHGVIRELSLVLAGANPGAFIDTIMSHNDEEGDAAIIFTDEKIELAHSEDEKEKEKNMDNVEKSKDEKTVKDVIDSMTEEQKTVMYALIGSALEHAEEDDEEEDENEEDNNSMKHNVFEGKENNLEDTLSHAEVTAAINDIKVYGSLRESLIRHGIEDVTLMHGEQTYGVTPIDVLYPDAKNVRATPDFISRDMGWVSKVLNGVHNTPFSRIKSIHANITEDEARAKGYIKGKLKKEEVFKLLKRSTTPTTIYKKQKLDRDDILDITDFDIIQLIRGEMRTMLDEEIARAILIGDGRNASDDDKIDETHIRPIATDDDLYNVKVNIEVTDANTEGALAKEFIKTVIRERKNYKGTGTPTLFTTENMLTEMLLLTDLNGRDIYDSVDKLATKLRVKEIVTVPVMENHTINEKKLVGIVVNMADYFKGMDRGGAINAFEDFDIDYNQQKYLLETRCSGALAVPYSAMTFTVNA